MSQNQNAPSEIPGSLIEQIGGLPKEKQAAIRLLIQNIDLFEKMMENEKIAAALTQAEEKIESFQEDERVQKGVSRLMDTCGRAAARIRKLFDR